MALHVGGHTFVNTVVQFAATAWKELRVSGKSKIQQFPMLPLTCKNAIHNSNKNIGVEKLANNAITQSHAAKVKMRIAIFAHAGDKVFFARKSTNISEAFTKWLAVICQSPSCLDLIVVEQDLPCVLAFVVVVHFRWPVIQFLLSCPSRLVPLEFAAGEAFQTDVFSNLIVRRKKNMTGPLRTVGKKDAATCCE